MSSVIHFPQRPQAPLTFPQWARTTLLSLAYLPRPWEAQFTQDDDGDESAVVGDLDGPDGGVLLAIARQGGVELLEAGTETVLGTFRNPDELRRAAIGYLDAVGTEAQTNLMEAQAGS